MVCFFFTPGIARQQVGFQAYWLRNYNDVSQGEVLEFESTDYNSGDYNTTTGMFTCSVPGLYYFSVTLAAGGTFGNPRYVYFVIMVGNSQKSLGYSYSDNGYPNFGTAHLVYRLSQGERVWVENLSSSARYRDIYYNNHFSGVLISPDIIEDN